MVQYKRRARTWRCVQSLQQRRQRLLICTRVQRVRVTKCHVAVRFCLATSCFILKCYPPLISTHLPFPCVSPAWSPPNSLCPPVHHCPHVYTKSTSPSVLCWRVSACCALQPSFQVLVLCSRLLLLLFDSFSPLRELMTLFLFQSGVRLVYGLIVFDFSSLGSVFDLGNPIHLLLISPPSGVIFSLKCCTLFISSICREAYWFC